MFIQDGLVTEYIIGIASNIADTIGSPLISGEFGVVYKGYLKKCFCDAVSEAVAVKTLKGIKMSNTLSYCSHNITAYTRICS